MRVVRGTDVGHSSVHRAVVPYYTCAEVYACGVNEVRVVVERLRLETSRRERGSHVYACSRWNYRSKFARRIKQQYFPRTSVSARAALRCIKRTWCYSSVEFLLNTAEITVTPSLDEVRRACY